jgi:glucosamine-6-phosphate deaminase
VKIVIAQTRERLGRFVADQAAANLRSCLANGASCNLVIATGSSQFEVLDSLVGQPDIDWSRVCGYHLDEYIGLDRQHSASFVGYLAARFVNRLPLKSFYFLEGTLPADELRNKACTAIEDQQIDLLLCGIGENGHLAFNDPPADFMTEKPYLIVDLDEACRMQQVGEGWFDRIENVPKQAISMSIHKIMSAKQILCTVPDRRKAIAVRNSIEGEITSAVPASILQRHPNVTLILDTASSSLLSPDSLESCEFLEEGST